MRIFLVASAATMIGALIIASDRIAAIGDDSSGSGQAAPPMTSQAPIASEAEVFRTRPEMLAVAPSPGPRRSAHPRTLATWRALRAYPGAPPRVPHGLTSAEFQTGGCKTCHERGGFSQRFGAYVPLTPHPERGACLQCHVGDGKLMAISLPSAEPSARCRQCHAPGAMRWRDTSDWIPLPWPRLADKTPGRDPPPIPHALQMRGNCLACHAAPSAVAEIQTRHPERASCRQCHVAVNEGASAFVRPVPSRREGGS
ncbi:MAG: hypothetical protein ACRENU_01565 [Gemmatimonadaceae bacterium]